MINYIDSNEMDIIECGKDLENKWTRACLGGDLKVIKNLIEKGIIDIEERDMKLNNTPLLFSCHNRCFNLIKYLLENGANVNSKNNKGMTPLIVVCCTYPDFRTNSDITRLKLVNLLIEHKVDIDICDDKGLTALHYVCDNRYDHEIIHKFIKYGSNIECKDNEGLTPLKYTFRRVTSDWRENDYYDYVGDGDKDYLKSIPLEILLDSGASLENMDEEEYTAMKASLLVFVEDYIVNETEKDRDKNEDVIEHIPLIIQLRTSTILFVSDLDQCYNRDEFLMVTPLMFACLKGNVKLVKTILNNKHFIDDITKNLSILSKFLEYKEGIKDSLPINIKHASRNMIY